MRRADRLFLETIWRRAIGNSQPAAFVPPVTPQALDHLTLSISSGSVAENAAAPTLTPHAWSDAAGTVAFGGGTSYAYSGNAPTVATINAGTGVITLQGPGAVTFTVTDSVSGKTAQVSLTVTTAPILTAVPSSFGGGTGATQQESFLLDGTDVTSDVIAYSSNPAVATITSAPEQPTVGAATGATATTLGIPVTSRVGGGTPTTVALEVDTNGNGTWVRQTAVAWTGSVTATQIVTATGLTASEDYAGKIRAVTITSAGESYVSSPITSGATNAAPTIGTLPVTRGLVERVHSGAGVTLNGSNVAQIVDQISGIKYAQANAAKQPPLTLNAYNGKPCIALADGKWLVTVDGTGTPVNVPGINVSNVGTVVIIGRQRSAAGASSFIISSHKSTSTTTGYALSGSDSNGRRAWYYGDGGATPSRIEESDASDLLLHSHSLISDSGSPNKELIYRDGTNLNGAGSVIIGNSTLPSYIGTDANNVGAAGTGSAYDFCEKLYFNVTLTSTELGQIHSYAQTEWGVP